MNESVNRAFMYGESVFTTLRLVDGKPRDWELHFERLKKSAEFLYGPFTEGEVWHSFLRDRLETRLDTEDGDKIVRLTLYREQERGLLPHKLISVMDLRLHVDVQSDHHASLDGKRYHLRTVPVSSRPEWWPSYLKTGNYLETILSQKKYLQADDDDLLFMSPSDTALESSVANIFVCRHDRLYTAPAGPHVLEGVMRKKVLSLGHECFSSVTEDGTTRQELLKADGIFGTNSVRGLFLVSRIDDYEISTTPEFLERFEKLKRVLDL